MVTTFKGIVSNGTIKPIEKTDLPEGEVLVTVSAVPKPLGDWLSATAGSWANLLDCDEFERYIYESRLRNSRPAPEL